MPVIKGKSSITIDLNIFFFSALHYINLAVHGNTSTVC
jgi:hypothetical protein